MSAAGNKKVLIIGLPKSGTSTLTTMLRILGYKVAGPNPEIHEFVALQNTFEAYDAFQDYPWCFEYPILLKNNEVQVILLKRDIENWVKSFKESYGGENESYLSYKYMKLSKNESDSVFHSYHMNYYEEASKFLESQKIDYLDVSINSLNWKILCDFLKKPIPRNLLGMISKIPRVNSKNHDKKGIFFELKKHFKKGLHALLGKNYFKLTSFIYKNK